MAYTFLTDDALAAQLIGPLTQDAPVPDASTQWQPTPKATVYRQADRLICRTLDGLAPKFRAAVVAGLTEANGHGFDVVVNETTRSDELQALYYSLGRDQSGAVINPRDIVTYAKSAQFSWHFFGLAIDIRSRQFGYDRGAAWWYNVAVIMKAHGLDWGGDWKRKDLPHFQWGTLKPSPSKVARTAFARGGVRDVWRLVGAL